MFLSVGWHLVTQHHQVTWLLKNYKYIILCYTHIFDKNNFIWKMSLDFWAENKNILSIIQFKPWASLSYDKHNKKKSAKNNTVYLNIEFKTHLLWLNLKQTLEINMTCPGYDVTSAYPPNEGKNLPWRIQFKSRPFSVFCLCLNHWKQLM